MTQREKLIELINDSAAVSKNSAEYLVDYLLAHDVVVLPCKVGDTVYYISFGKIYVGKCHCISIHNNIQIHLYDYDGDNATCDAKDVFLTREEAEAALKERDAAVKELNEKCQNCGYKYHSERISELHDCNDCGKKSKCEYEPRPGEYCRINCPHWEEDNNE